MSSQLFLDLSTKLFLLCSLFHQSFFFIHITSRFTDIVRLSSISSRGVNYFKTSFIYLYLLRRHFYKADVSHVQSTVYVTDTPLLQHASCLPFRKRCKPSFATLWISMRRAYKRCVSILAQRWTAVKFWLTYRNALMGINRYRLNDVLLN